VITAQKQKSFISGSIAAALWSNKVATIF